MPQFDILTYSSQVFWLVLIFGFIYFIVYKFVAPRAEQILQNRHNFLSDQVNSASVMAERTAQLKEAYDIEYKDIMNLASNIQKEALSNLGSIFTKKKLDLEHELNEQKEKAIYERDQIIKSFQLDAASGRVDLASLIIEKITNKDANQELLMNILKTRGFK
jgi:F-type H+-transporting ATPase subunit b